METGHRNVKGAGGRPFQLTLKKPWLITAICAVSILLILTIVFGFIAFPITKKQRTEAKLRVPTWHKPSTEGNTPLQDVTDIIDTAAAVTPLAVPVPFDTAPDSARTDHEKTATESIAGYESPDEWKWYSDYRLRTFANIDNDYVEAYYGSGLIFTDNDFFNNDDADDGVFDFRSYNSHLVGFSTNRPTVAAVEYGTTSAYGNFAYPDTDFNSYFTNHLIYIRGLAEGTNYHYRIIAADADGNQIISKERSFTTRKVTDEIVINFPNKKTVQGEDINGVTQTYEITDFGAIPGGAGYEIGFTKQLWLTEPYAKYVLQSDLIFPAGGIYQAAAGVTIDLNGHTVIYNEIAGEELLCMNTNGNEPYWLSSSLDDYWDMSPDELPFNIKLTGVEAPGSSFYLWRKDIPQYTETFAEGKPTIRTYDFTNTPRITIPKGTGESRPNSGEADNPNGFVWYNGNATFGVQASGGVYWGPDPVLFSVFNGSVLQGAGRSPTPASGGGGVITHAREIAGVTASYNGAQGHGFDIGGNNIDNNIGIHHCVIIDKGTIVLDRHSQASASGTGDKAYYSNTLIGVRQCGVSGAGEKFNNEVYMDSYVTNSIGIQGSGASHNNRIYGMGFLAIGMWIGDETARTDNMIYLRAYAPSKRSAEYGTNDSRLSGVAGIRVTFNNEMENVLFENNTVLTYVDTPAGYAKGAWVLTSLTQNNIWYVNNVFLAEGNNEFNGGDVETFMIHGGSVHYNEEYYGSPVKIEGNIFAGNGRAIAIGDGYSVGGSAVFRNNKIIQTGIDSGRFQPVYIQQNSTGSVHNRFILPTEDTQMDRLPPQIGGFGNDTEYELLVGYTKKLTVTDKKGSNISAEKISVTVRRGEISLPSSYTTKWENYFELYNGVVARSISDVNIMNADGSVAFDLLKYGYYLRDVSGTDSAKYPALTNDPFAYPVPYKFATYTFHVDGWKDITLSVDQLAAAEKITFGQRSNWVKDFFNLPFFKSYWGGVATTVIILIPIGVALYFVLCRNWRPFTRKKKDPAPKSS
jgi:hypothetical protein